MLYIVVVIPSFVSTFVRVFEPIHRGNSSRANRDIAEADSLCHQ